MTTYRLNQVAAPSSDPLRAQRKAAVALIALPSVVRLASFDSPSTETLASPGGAAVLLGILAASLIWRRARGARAAFFAWAALIVFFSFYPTPQLQGEPFWSVLVSCLFAALLAVLGRQVWRVTERE